jgi:hypothetical protein
MLSHRPRPPWRPGISTPDLPASSIARQNGVRQLQKAAMAANEKPSAWQEWKAKHPRWHRLRVSTLSGLEYTVASGPSCGLSGPCAYPGCRGAASCGTECISSVPKASRGGLSPSAKRLIYHIPDPASGRIRGTEMPSLFHGARRYAADD